MSNPALAIIESQRLAVAKLRTDLGAAEAELRGMERLYLAIGSIGDGQSRQSHTTEAVHHSSVTAPAKPVIPPFIARSVGKQPGTISRRSRTLLAHLRRNLPDGFSPQAGVKAIEQLEGRFVKAGDIRRLLDGYVQHGFLNETGDGRYTVTERAVSRFGLDSIGVAAPVRASEPVQSDYTHTENGEAAAEPDDRDEGAPTPSHPQHDL